VVIRLELNNKGWGTAQMFLLSGGLLIALLVAVFFIARLYSSLDGTVGNKQYIDLEFKLETAAREYINSKGIDINGEITINYNTLKTNNFVDELKDIDGNHCNGYVKINNVDNVNHYTGYISCNDYRTPNY